MFTFTFLFWLIFFFSWKTYFINFFNIDFFHNFCFVGNIFLIRIKKKISNIIFSMRNFFVKFLLITLFSLFFTIKKYFSELQNTPYSWLVLHKTITFSIRLLNIPIYKFYLTFTL